MNSMTRPNGQWFRDGAPLSAAVATETPESAAEITKEIEMPRWRGYF